MDWERFHKDLAKIIESENTKDDLSSELLAKIPAQLLSEFATLLKERGIAAE